MLKDNGIADFSHWKKKISDKVEIEIKREIT